jgi:hypothetical protein
VLSEPRELTEEEEEKMRVQKWKTFNQTPRLGDVLGGARVRKLYGMIASQFTVKEIWTGGGGNTEEKMQCVCMCGDKLAAMENGDRDALDMSWAIEKLRP